MLTCDEIVQELELHSVQERVTIIDTVLHGVIQSDSAIENAWLDEAERRWNEYKAGRSRSVSLDHVMARYGKPA